MGKIYVEGATIQVLQIEENDYISLTDMVRQQDNGSALIEKWLRNKNTIEFLGIWEEMYNMDFDIHAYDEIMQEAELNRFVMSAKQWIDLPFQYGKYQCLVDRGWFKSTRALNKTKQNRNPSNGDFRRPRTQNLEITWIILIPPNSGELKWASK